MKRLLLILSPFFLIFLLSLSTFYINPFEKITKMSVDIKKYKEAEKEETNITSRKLMIYALDIAKKENFAPAEAARFYAYVASVYSDVLEETESSSEATLATSEIMNYLVPKYRDQNLTFARLLLAGEARLSQKGRNILEKSS